MHDDSREHRQDEARIGAAQPRGGITITLRDDSIVTVRPICPQDAEPLHAGFERLSKQSRYRRFLSPIQELSPRSLRYLTDIDHHQHEALVAVGADGSILGVARFVRSRVDPEVAEAAVTVADDWQGRGLGTALLGLLADRARVEGISHFTALMLASNREMLELFEDLGPVRILRHGSGTVELEITLPERGVGPHLRELLRGSASGRYNVEPRALPAPQNTNRLS